MKKKVLIEIDDEVYKHIKEHSGLAYAVEDYLHEVEWAIKNGTPLPKEHGRLIDADAISLDDINFFSISDYRKMVRKLSREEPTIIEADKAENEDVMTHQYIELKLEELEKALEQEPKWIPVSERLPKYNTPVLLALKQIGKERAIVIGERRTRKSGWYFVDIAAYDTEHEVIAWMPLPEPYKAESGDKE